jgi:hypothetical protein
MAKRSTKGARPEIVTEALEFYRAAESARQKQRSREKDDLRCQVPSEMWTSDVVASRKGGQIKGITATARPMIALDVLSEPVQLVTSTQRSAHLGITIQPLTPDANDDTAEVLQDLYRQIEVDSRAAFARDWSFDRSTKCGFGCYHILSEYDRTTGVPGDQKLVIKRILDQSMVYFDPFATEPDFSDGERALVIEDMPWRTYCRKYKKSKLRDYTDDGLNELGTDDANKDWIGGDGPDSRTVRIGMFYYVEHSTETVTIAGAGEDGRDLEFEDDKRIVRCCKVNAIEELESFTWGGQYIPLVPTIGNELQPFDGERRWSGMYTNAKEAARLTMYAASGAIEMAALEPLAPWQADPRVIEGFEEEYRQSNTRRIPVLHYNAEVDGRPMERPSRVQVDMSRLGPNMQLLTMGRDFVQAATSTYDPSLGKQPTAHRSGRAIVALQDQNLAATNSYQANFKDITLMCESRIILDAIPAYYDRPGRLLTLRDEEQKTWQAIVNAPSVTPPGSQRPMPLPYDTPEAKAATDAQVNDLNHPAVHYDLKKGRYGVSVTIAKSYQSKLEEGQSEIGDIMQSDPSLVPLIGPVYFKYRDGPGMKEIGKILTKQRDHAMPWLSDNPQAGDPARLQAENAALKQQLQAAGMAIQTKQVEQQGKLEVVKIQEAADTQRNRENNETKLAVAELGAKVDRLTLFLEERARLGIQQHEAGMALMDHAATTQQQGQVGAQDAALAAQQHDQALQQGDQAHGQALVQNAQQAALTPPPQNESGQ